MTKDCVFITTLEGGPGTGLALAVKDNIDVAGVPTTCGSRLLAATAAPAAEDAQCLLGAREAGVRIVGKTNLVELAFGAHGMNSWYGTPRNPLDRSLLPGGSSSGSAVAVATGMADVALGTDTGGSIRIPAACCGTVGLKTTFGRIPVGGVQPLAPALDSVGPMAVDVARVVEGMRLLEPGFAVSAEVPTVAGWAVERTGARVDGRISEAVRGALVRAGMELREVEVSSWRGAWTAGTALLEKQAAVTFGSLRGLEGQLDPTVAARLRSGWGLSWAEVRAAREVQVRWEEEMRELLDRVGLLALPTMGCFPPRLDEYEVAGIDPPLNWFTLPVNLAGLPSLSLPVPCSGPVPASVQLVGPLGSEDRLLACGLAVEEAAWKEGGWSEARG